MDALITFRKSKEAIFVRFWLVSNFTTLTSSLQQLLFSPFLINKEHLQVFFSDEKTATPAK